MKIIAVSGYFVILHIGHIEYFRKANEMGRAIEIGRARGREGV